MEIIEILAKKRDNKELDRAEIHFLLQNYLSGELSDAQMAAFTMACCCNKLTFKETLSITNEMLASSEKIDLTGTNRICIDKHATGGVGEKTSLIVAPLVASLGYGVPLLSGRALGHTGGTLDKLASLPGFTSNLSESEFISTVKTTGMAICATTESLVPLDKKLYSLRSKTATEKNTGLILSSILSKKLSINTKAIILDVTVGSGGFFENLKEARKFARKAILIGDRYKHPVHCVLTAMDRPLGKSIGNWIEVKEAIDVLKGAGPRDTANVSVALATEMIYAVEPTKKYQQIFKTVESQLSSGLAFKTFIDWLAAQGTSLDSLEKVFYSPRPKETLIGANKNGYLDSPIPELLARFLEN